MYKIALFRTKGLHEFSVAKRQVTKLSNPFEDTLKRRVFCLHANVRPFFTEFKTCGEVVGACTKAYLISKWFEDELVIKFAIKTLTKTTRLAADCVG